MKTSYIIVGKSLQLNTLFLAYIDLHVKKSIGQISEKYFLDNNDKNILLDLEKIINENDKTIIVANKNGFNIVSKILCTLSEDSLELKEETLTPSRANHFSKDSYLIELNSKEISVLCAKENSTLPLLHVKNLEASNIFSIVGMDEDTTKILLDPLASTYDVKLASTALVDGWTQIEAKASKYGDIESFLEAATSLFPDKIIKNENPIEFIVNTLINLDKSICTAESCTGGLIASLITSISGSSSVFHGGIVSYSNDIKRSWLGVSEDTLKTYGAVSELCVREMMEGALNASLSDFALATSGIAGPTGGSSEKPVGTVFVGARAKNGEAIVERLLLQGDREYIQMQSVYHSFRLLLMVGRDYFFKN